MLTAGAPIVAVLTLPLELGAARSGHVDFSTISAEFGVRLEYIRHINDERARALIESLQLDVAFVIGWSQLVAPEVLRLPRLGMIGAHASLLPQDRGRAPINWALIKGRTHTGNSLMWLAPGADTGDLIDQMEIPITPYDTCATLYQRVADTNRTMLLRVLPRLLAGERPGRPQGPAVGPPLPGRKPSDGAIDWSRDRVEIYDFVRALTRPYPGAFAWLDDQQYRVWRCALLPANISADSWRPGAILGPVISPVADACGQAVACGRGSVVLLEVEDEHGTTLRGQLLSEQRWAGRVWRSYAPASVGRGRPSG
jgi:methionyl-tRNA formyltransferase